MNERECKVFYKALDSSKVQEELARFKKYVDGLAFDEENLGLLKDILSEAKGIFEEKYEVMLIGAGKSLMQALSVLGEGKFKVLVAPDKLEDVAKLKKTYREFSDIELGIHITKPTVSLAPFARHEVKFVVMPPTLVRGRLISEAKARKIDVVAYPVNDVTTYVRLLELGVSAVVTTDPAIGREARKLLKM